LPDVAPGDSFPSSGPNTLEIGKAIYSSKIPVMTAIGHELDVTIADLVADVRASVPMDAGQRLTDPWVKAEERIDTIEENIVSGFKNACRALDANLTIYKDNFISCYAKLTGTPNLRYLVDSRRMINNA
jgi:exonuclease VII large subunit